MREPSGCADYEAIAQAICEAEAAAQRSEIIPPAPLAIVPRTIDRAKTRLIAFPTLAIEDAELAVLPIAAKVTIRSKSKAASRSRPQRSAGSAGPLANLSRTLNALLIAATSLSGLVFGGATGLQPGSSTSRHLEMSVLTVPDHAPSADSSATAAGMTAAWLELRRARTAEAMSPPVPVFTWANLPYVVVSQEAVRPVRVASIVLANHTDVAPVAVVAAAPAERFILTKSEDAALAPGAVPARSWETATVPAAAASRRAKPQNTRAPEVSTQPATAQSKPSKSAKRAPQSIKRQAQVATPTALGAARPATATERPQRQQTAKTWTSGAFEASR